MNLHVVGPDGRRYEVQGTGAQIGRAKHPVHPSVIAGSEFDRYVKLQAGLKKQLNEKYRLP